MNHKKKTLFQRRCTKCDNIYHTKHRTSKICTNCYSKNYRGYKDE